ncbi:MAG: T9SS type A sorting domain-containing protein [Candidatus Marinimicrobia bacterium]|nr:T9SS type A sorting domain-containing protein [Candidatus Neomarinimicrobiota bacterium]
MIEDPVGDGGVVDIILVRGASTSGVLEIEMVFATVLDPFDFGGFLSLDIDQDPTTGVPPSFGNPNQDIGTEFEFSFFSLGTGVVDLFDAVLGQYVGSFPVEIDSYTLRFSTPLADIGNDDGKMDVTGVIGDAIGPTDWFPDEGHGTIGVSWLTANPALGTIPAGTTMDVTLTFNAAGLSGGDYDADIVITSNDPANPEVRVSAHLRVDFTTALDGFRIDDDQTGNSWGNSDGLASPGEFLEVYLSVANLGDSAISGAYIIPDPGFDPYVSPNPTYFLDTFISSATELPPGVVTEFLDDFDFYVDGSAPADHILTVPLAIYNGSDILIGEDTLRVPTSGSDIIAPRALPVSVNPSGYSPVGTPITIEAFIWEAGGIAGVSAQIEAPDENVVAALVMVDDGTNGDVLAGNRVYTAQFTPVVEADFFVDIQASDGFGNSGLLENANGFTTQLFTPSQPMLLVADDNPRGLGRNYEDLFSQTMDAQGYEYDTWRNWMRGTITGDVLDQYLDGVVVWYIGWNYPTLDESEQLALGQFLDNGGRLVITDQDLGWDLNVGTQAGSEDWYQAYLHARFVQDDIDLYAVNGVPGQYVGENMRIPLTDIYTGGTGVGFYPDEIAPLQGAATVLAYDTLAVPPFGAAGRRSSPVYDVFERGAPPSSPIGARLLGGLNTGDGPMQAGSRTGSQSRRPASVAADPIREEAAAAVAVNTARHRLVYFAFGLEAVVDPAQRTALLGQAVEWLQGLPTTDQMPPRIISIDDVPEDQGGWAAVTWAASANDRASIPDQVASYTIWLRNDLPADSPAGVGPSVPPTVERQATQGHTTPVSKPSGKDESDLHSLLAQEPGSLAHAVEGVSKAAAQSDWSGETAGVPGPDPAEEVQVILSSDGEWISLGSVNATQDSVYTFLAHTLRDSNHTGLHWSYFKVSAHGSTDPDHFSFSEVDSGYSVDNIAPGVPANLMAIPTDVDVHLSWSYDFGAAADFQYFAMYRGTEAGFAPLHADSSLTTTTDTVYTDEQVEPGVAYFYRVAAVDYNGNFSELSGEATGSLLAVVEGAGIPEAFALWQNYPNPFNPSTIIRFDLPEATHLTLIIYDLLGREVARLRQGAIEPGYHQVVWNGRTAAGQEATAGLYIVRLVSPTFTRKIKMVLLK